MKERGFTLIELMVVISIISLLASVVVASLNSAKSKARDAIRKQDLNQLRIALELKYNDTGSYLYNYGGYNASTSSAEYAAVTSLLVSKYIPKIVTDPLYPTGGYWYVYLNHDWPGGGQWTCSTTDPNQVSSTIPLADSTRYSIYAHLENPSAKDISTTQDSPFDICASNYYNMNYKVGN